MLRIAICDDDKNLCIDLENKLKKILIENNCDFKIMKIYSIEELYKYFYNNTDAFDMIFLDIKFNENGMAGLEIGNTIRKRFCNEIVKIIYISNFTEYIIDLFRTQPFDFCKKPISYEKVNEIINSVLQIMNRQNKSFIYKFKGITKKIDLYKILYFVNHGRKIEIVTFKKKPENNSFYGKLSDVSERLAKSDFFFIHQSYLVNYHNVKFFEYTKLKLIDGTELYISQRYRKNIQKMVIEHKLFINYIN